MGETSDRRDWTATRIGTVIVVVTYRGVYPPGSAGNAFADEMVAFAREPLANGGAAAILFDMSDLEYTFGDAICGLAMLLVAPGNRPLPAAIVANGATARALAPLLEPAFLLGVAGVKRFGSREDAIAYLEREVGDGA